jgi:dephospho-CoA kinase
MRVGLTGGVGSGKSTVARLLADLGAVIIDADAIAHEVVEPGTPGFDAVVERFGRGVVRPDGSLDRAGLAGIVFADDTQRQALNAIVHPLVGARMAELAAAASADAVVVWDVPLLVENDSAGGFDMVVVVEADVPIRLARLVERGMSEQDARERIKSQATDEQRRAVADVVIENNGDLAALRERVRKVWKAIQQRRVGAPGGG